MRLWVFSDLHLNDPQSSFYQSFLKVLDEPNHENDIVVLAGDIFDLMVGKSAYFSQKYASFFEKLKALAAQKVKLYYIEGNHDFHIKDQFKGIPITFEEESVRLKVQTASAMKSIYIAHGDLVDKSDVWYLRLRKVLRSKPVVSFIDAVPGSMVEMIGEKWSRPEQRKGHDLPENWSEAGRTRLRKIYREFAIQKKNEGFDYVILGHCHDLDEIQPFYFNMGFPPVHGQFLFYDSLEDCVKRKSLRK